jgi:broad specificity phosphatase PhoE
MATLSVIRHGQASFGSENYDRLSPLGERQARCLGDYFRDVGIRIDAAYCGSLVRQRHTAELALAPQSASVPLHADPRLDEVRNDEQIRVLLPRLLPDNPALQALVDRGLNSSKDYQKVIAAVFNHWVSPDCDADGIQSWADYSGAVHGALADIMASEGRGRHVALFTSGGTIATLVAHVLELPDTQVYRFYEPIFNASITQFFYSGSRISLSSFNDCSYLRTIGARAGENLVSYR